MSDTKTLSQVQNPFAQTAPAAHGTEVQKASASSEIMAAISMAKHSPRDPMRAMDRILQSCTRPTLAEQALYAYSRGGTEISGPSIRLAEECARQWGNMRFGIAEVSRDSGSSEILAYAWDMETNTFASRQFHVEHMRDKRGGGVKLTDQRDIYELTANQGARRLRACILELIPGDVVDEAVKQCLLTQQSGGKGTTEDQIANLLEAYGALGVTKEMIQKRQQKRVDAITQAELPGLKRIYRSLRDGMSEIDQWFEVEAEKSDDKAKIEPPTPPKPETPPPTPKTNTAPPASAEKPEPEAPKEPDDADLAIPDVDPPAGPPIDDNGEVWNPEIHATSSETGGPSYNKDGTFRMRRGVAAKRTDEAPEQGALIEGESTPVQEEPEPQPEPEPEPEAKGVDFNGWAAAATEATSLAEIEALRAQIPGLPTAMQRMCTSICDKKAAEFKGGDDAGPE